MTAPGYHAGRTGAAAVVVRVAYGPGFIPMRPGGRAALARAARAGAASASAQGIPHHAPPYPVPVRAWRGRAW